MRTCKHCGGYKPDHDFNFRDKAAGKYQRYCRDCQKKQMKDSYQRNKSHYVAQARARSRFYQQDYDSWKQQLTCVACGENTACCIELHHIDSSQKEGNPSLLFRTLGRKRFFEELQKCAVVCSNCHKKIHAQLLILSIDQLEQSSQQMVLLSRRQFIKDVAPSSNGRTLDFDSRNAEVRVLQGHPTTHGTGAANTS